LTERYLWPSSVGRSELKRGREQVEIIAPYEELGSYRTVAALLGCDHKTVKRYVELAPELGQLAPTGAGRGSPTSFMS
jgi:hypothetical protein